MSSIVPPEANLGTLVGTNRGLELRLSPDLPANAAMQVIWGLMKSCQDALWTLQQMGHHAANRELLIAAKAIDITPAAPAQEPAEATVEVAPAVAPVVEPTPAVAPVSVPSVPAAAPEDILPVSLADVATNG